MFNLTFCSSLRELPESIGQLHSLTRFNLICCLSVVTLPESIGQLHSLTDLDLGHGHFMKLPESIGQLRSLRVLKLEHVPLTALPESIGQLVNLKELELKKCCLLKSLPNSIKGMKSLEKCESLASGLPEEEICRVNRVIEINRNRSERFPYTPNQLYVGLMLYIMSLKQGETGIRRIIADYLGVSYTGAVRKWEEEIRIEKN